MTLAQSLYERVSCLKKACTVKKAKYLSQHKYIEMFSLSFALTFDRTAQSLTNN
jgi:hypothetical protein